jgi:dihydroflavonol-4-reductase
VRVLITGATGFIGGHLASLAAASGAEVRLLVRDRGRWQGQPAELVVGDLSDNGALREAASGVDRVFHVAGLTKARYDREYFEVNHLGTVNLLEACRQENPGLERFVLVSSQAAAGPARNGQPVVEADEPRPTSPYGQSKLRGEAAVRAFAPLFDVTTVRPPVVYGPGDRDTLLVFRAARYGVVPRLASLRALSIVHVTDLVRGIWEASECPAAKGKTYYLANHEPVTVPDIALQIARDLGARPFEVRLPSSLLYLGAIVSESRAALAGSRTPVTRNKVTEALERDWICDSSQAQEDLGWAPHIPIDRGIAETASWYRDRGWL